MKKYEILGIGNQIALRWEAIFHALFADFTFKPDETRPADTDGPTLGDDLPTQLNRYSLIGLVVMLFPMLLSVSAVAQDNGVSSFLKPVPRNYAVKQAIEVESLFPMFLTGGYHFAVGYRYKKFRVRVSVINGGTYNAETVGLNNSSPAFKRFYNTSPGIFLGYNVWKNLEVYTYLESHTFSIEQESTGIKKDIKSIDTGLGVSYQFFIGPIFYVQPGVHLYLRRNNSTDFGPVQYNIPNADISPVIRIGARLWRQY